VGYDTNVEIHVQKTMILTDSFKHTQQPE